MREVRKFRMEELFQIVSIIFNVGLGVELGELGGMLRDRNKIPLTVEDYFTLNI